ncbi:hypothetical protein PENSPDRAFT_666413 [Peniophora sp. CONT]|nr:hypothetical protein PENSPDRAFT_666413 [Peniophora sp. CONT]
MVHTNFFHDGDPLPPPHTHPVPPPKALGFHLYALAVCTYRPKPPPTLRPLPSGLDPSLNHTKWLPIPPLRPKRPPGLPPPPNPRHDSLRSELDLKAILQTISRQLEKRLTRDEYVELMKRKKKLENARALGHTHISHDPVLGEITFLSAPSTVSYVQLQPATILEEPRERAIVDVSRGIYRSFPGDALLRQLLPHTTLERSLSLSHLQSIDYMRSKLAKSLPLTACALCGWSVQYTPGLVDHVHDAHLGITWKCDFCWMCLESRHGLFMHVWKIHRDRVEESEERRKRRVAPFTEMGWSA